MQPNYNHNQGPINFFPPLEANYHITRGVCLLNSNPPFFLFFFVCASAADPADYEGL